MGNFFEDTMQGLVEALEIKNGGIQLIEKEDMPAPTFTTVSDDTCNTREVKGLNLNIDLAYPVGETG
jgi:hypothetical protein